jgi:hypothetical protein
MRRAYSARPYLDMLGLADYLAFRGATRRGRMNAARAWVERTGIPKKFRGKAWLVHPDDVDAALSGEQVSA